MHTLLALVRAGARLHYRAATHARFARATFSSGAARPHAAPTSVPPRLAVQLRRLCRDGRDREALALAEATVTPLPSSALVSLLDGLAAGGRGVRDAPAGGLSSRERSDAGLTLARRPSQLTHGVTVGIANALLRLWGVHGLPSDARSGDLGTRAEALPPSRPPVVAPSVDLLRFVALAAEERALSASGEESDDPYAASRAFLWQARRGTWLSGPGALPAGASLATVSAQELRASIVLDEGGPGVSARAEFDMLLAWASRQGGPRSVAGVNAGSGVGSASAMAAAAVAPIDATPLVDLPQGATQSAFLVAAVLRELTGVLIHPNGVAIPVAHHRGSSYAPNAETLSAGLALARTAGDVRAVLAMGLQCRVALVGPVLSQAVALLCRFGAPADAAVLLATSRANEISRFEARAARRALAREAMGAPALSELPAPPALSEDISRGHSAAVSECARAGAFLQALGAWKALLEAGAQPTPSAVRAALVSAATLRLPCDVYSLVGWVEAQRGFLTRPPRDTRSVTAPIAVALGEAHDPTFVLAAAKVRMPPLLPAIRQLAVAHATSMAPLPLYQQPQAPFYRLPLDERATSNARVDAGSDVANFGQLRILPSRASEAAPVADPVLPTAALCDVHSEALVGAVRAVSALGDSQYLSILFLRELGRVTALQAQAQHAAAVGGARGVPERVSFSTPLARAFVSGFAACGQLDVAVEAARACLVAGARLRLSSFLSIPGNALYRTELPAAFQALRLAAVVGAASAPAGEWSDVTPVEAAALPLLMRMAVRMARAGEPVPPDVSAAIARAASILTQQSRRPTSRAVARDATAASSHYAVVIPNGTVQRREGASNSSHAEGVAVAGDAGATLASRAASAWPFTDPVLSALVRSVLRGSETEPAAATAIVAEDKVAVAGDASAPTVALDERAAAVAEESEGAGSPISLPAYADQLLASSEEDAVHIKEGGLGSLLRRVDALERGAQRQRGVNALIAATADNGHPLALAANTAETVVSAVLRWSVQQLQLASSSAARQLALATQVPGAAGLVPAAPSPLAISSSLMLQSRSLSEGGTDNASETPSTWEDEEDERDALVAAREMLAIVLDAWPVSPALARIAHPHGDISVARVRSADNRARVERKLLHTVQQQQSPAAPATTLTALLAQSISYADYLSRVAALPAQMQAHATAWQRVRWARDTVPLAAAFGPSFFYEGGLLVDAAQEEVQSSARRAAQAAASAPRGTVRGGDAAPDSWEALVALVNSVGSRSVARKADEKGVEGAESEALATATRQARGRTGTVLASLYAGHGNGSEALQALEQKHAPLRARATARGVALWAGGLAPSVDEAALRDAFASAGAPVPAKVRLVQRPSVSGAGGDAWAVLEFETPADASGALDALAFVPLHGRPLQLKASTPGMSAGYERNAAAAIYIHAPPPVGGLDEGSSAGAATTLRDLYVAFSRYGDIHSVRILDKGAGGGTADAAWPGAIVRFAETAAADAALADARAMALAVSRFRGGGGARSAQTRA